MAPSPHSKPTPHSGRDGTRTEDPATPAAEADVISIERARTGPGGGAAGDGPPSGAGREERGISADVPPDPLEAALGSAMRSLAELTVGQDWRPRLESGLAFLRRRMTGDYEVDDLGFDADLTDEVLLPALRPLFNDWFRAEVRGVENIPDEGGALVVANHSGTLPLDGLMTMVACHDHHPRRRHLRLLAADLVFELPVVSEIARKSGATLACGTDAQRLLRSGELVAVYPEGFKGLGKPYGERYKLQRFGRGGFVSQAMRAGVPIVPCSIVGAEEAYPMLANIAPLARLLGVPYLPITPTFPVLGPLGLVPLPSKWIIEFGTPISTEDYEADAADDPMLVFNLTDQVRETIQHTLYALLLDRRHAF